MSTKSISKKNDWLSIVYSMDPNAPAEMVISGRIGKDGWDGSGTSSKDFRDELKKIPAGTKIKVRINSEGGSIQDGIEIYNVLKDRRQDVTCFVDGYAVSIASIIALGGSKTISPKSSIWMIHEPWSVTQGNAEDHRDAAEMLDKHGDMLASIYAEETGKSKQAMREAMVSETWMTGEEAVEFGLADEMVDDSVDLAALNPKAFKNIPTAILARISAAAPKADTHNATVEPGPVADAAALLSDSTTEAGPAGTAASDNTETMHIQNMETTAQAAVPTPTANNELAELRKQMLAEKTSRVTSEVMRRAENKIANENLAFWISNAMNDEQATYRQIDALPVAQVGGESVGRASVISENPLDQIKKAGDQKAQHAFMVHNWKDLMDEAYKRDSRPGRPQNSNTLSPTITTAFLISGAITKLQNRWAPLRSFTRDYSTDPYKPKAMGVLKYVDGFTATTSSGKNITDFEDGDTTIDPINITVDQYTRPFNVSNSDLQSGLRMEDLVSMNTAVFADMVIAVATAPITVANFGTQAGATGAALPLVSASSAFGFGDLRTLWGGLKKSPVKNLILDGEYMAGLLNQPAFFQKGVASENDGSALQTFGWDGLYLNTNWTGAGANIVGFACGNQAIGGITGLPVAPQQGYNGTLSVSSFTIPDLEVSVAVYNWFSLASRAMWCSYDIMAGFKEMDKTAGILIKSA